MIFNYAKNVARLLQVAVTLGVENLTFDGAGFRQGYDKIEAERLLPT